MKIIVNTITQHKVCSVMDKITVEQMKQFLLKSGIKNTWQYALMSEEEFESMKNTRQTKYGLPPTIPTIPPDCPIVYKGKEITITQLKSLRARCKAMGILETKTFVNFRPDPQECFDYCLDFIHKKGQTYEPIQK
jgi:hypothetical protein